MQIIQKFFLGIDFDGDGATDIIYLLRESFSLSSYKLFVSFPKKGIFNKLVSNVGFNSSFSSWDFRGDFQVVDFNGDGKHDLLVTRDDNSNRSRIFDFDFDNSGLLLANSLYSSGFPTKWHRVYQGDFNGDGKTDLLTRDISNNNASWNIAYSTGVNFDEKPFSFAYTSQPDITGMDDDDKLIVGDYNGDGRSDVYLGQNIAHSGWAYGYPYTYYKGTNTVFYSKGGNNFWYRKYEGSLLGDLPAIPFDLNGDGRRNIVNRKNYTTSSKLTLSFNRDGKDLLLEKVKNGINHETKIEYQRMNDKGNGNQSIYSRSIGNNYPINSISSSLNLVRKIEMPDGIGGVNGQSFTYANAKVDKTGKGYLGMLHVKTTDLKTGNYGFVNKMVVSGTNTPTTLMPVNSISYVKNAAGGYQNMGITTSIHSFVHPTSGANTSKRYVHHFDETKTVSSFSGTSSKTNFVYDSYGNPTKTTKKIFTSYNTTGTPKETSVTDITYITANTPVPAKPKYVTETVTRQGEPAYQNKQYFYYYPSGGARKGQLYVKYDFFGTNKQVRTYFDRNYSGDGMHYRTRVYPTGLSTRYSYVYYDSKSRFITSTKNPLGQTSSKVYEPRFGNVVSETGITTLKNGYEYDGFGRLKKTIVYAPGNIHIDFSTTQDFAWDFDSSLKSVYKVTSSHPAKPDTKVWHDILGRKVQTQTEGFQNKWITNQMEYSYNVNNNYTPVVKNIGPFKSGETAMETTSNSDRFGRVISIAKTGGFGTSTIGYVYQSGELKTTTTSPDNQINSKWTDVTGKVTKAQDYGGILNYTYYSHGNIKNVKNGSQTMVTNYYDVAARQTKMVDVNAGTTEYTYDALGQLTWQKNANGDIHTMQYDKLGRSTTKTMPEGSIVNEYYPSNSYSKTNQIKKVTAFSGTDQVKEEYNYDTRGRLWTKKETVDNVGYTSTFTYNNFGQLTLLNYPSGFGIRYSYENGTGHTTFVKSKDYQETLYTNMGMNGYNQLTKYKMGDANYSPVMNIDYHFGVPIKYHDVKGGLNWYDNQELELNWNFETGNLNFRNDIEHGKNESFTYDNLNRLKTSSVNGIQQMNLNFANNGNISSKSDVGTYQYQTGKINALTEVTNNVNTIPTLTQSISYNSFLQPTRLTEGSYTLDYKYGADEQRIKSTTKNNNTTTNVRYYFDGFEKDVYYGTTQYLHYISVGSQLISIVKRSGSTNTYYYTYTDHLGSILAVANASGARIAEQNFDAWGRKRHASNYSYSGVPTAPSYLIRGYTGHEGLPNFRLINMNGRMYDPVVGRMLSVDNFIHGGTQGLNRYSYALNNPLKYSDPDGEHPLIFAMVFAGVLNGGIQVGLGNANNLSDYGKAFGQGALTSLMAGGTVWNAIGAVGSSYLPSINVISSDHLNINLSPSIAFSSTGFNLGAAVDVSVDTKYVRAGVSFGLGYSRQDLGENILEGVSSFSGGGLSLGTKDWNVGLYSTSFNGGGTNQKVGGVNVTLAGVSLRYENDYAPFDLLGENLQSILNDQGDRWRTAAFSVGYGDFDARVNLFTGEPNGDPVLRPHYPLGVHTGDADMYRFGTVTVGYKGYRTGWNSEGIRDYIQNTIAHTKVRPQPYFRRMESGYPGSLYSQFSTHSNPYSLWQF